MQHCEKGIRNSLPFFPGSSIADWPEVPDAGATDCQREHSAKNQNDFVNTFHLNETSYRALAPPSWEIAFICGRTGNTEHFSSACADNI